MRRSRRGSRGWRARTPAVGPLTPATPSPPGLPAASPVRRGRPLPIAETLRVGTELAEALAAAHKAGVVHRDLKPGNIMLTASGAKVLDFGLAKQHAGGATETEPSALTRAADPLTEAGTRLGTIPYMAPEQVEGKEADARSDVFALGAILYEMATGRRAFEGETPASVAAAILEREPAPVTALEPLTPPAFEHVVMTCLAKDPEARWQAAGDIARELRWICTSGAGTGPAALPATPPKQARERLAWVVAAVMAAAALALGAVALAGSTWMRGPAEPSVMRFAVTAPAGGTVVSDATSAAISLDGQRLVLTLVDRAGIPRLWIRPLDTLSAQPLAGTENALFPFWSPDSRFVAFFAEGKLRKIPAVGGPVEVICDAPTGRGGTWSRDGVIVLAPAVMGPLVRVSPDGGAVVEVARPDPARGETGLRFPSFLPDGKHFLYVSLPKKQGEEVDVYVGQVESGESRRIMSAGSSPVYAEPGYLLFDRRSRLAAQRFDLQTLMPIGEAVTLGDVSPITFSDGASLVSVSANGVLARVATLLPDTELVWLDRAGRTQETIPLPPASYAAPSLSPDGRRAIVTKASSPTSYDLWLVDLERAVASRLTFDGLVASVDATGVWSPDGRYAAYMHNRSGVYDVYQVAIGGGRQEPLVQSDAIFKSPVAWSPDGAHLVFSQNDATDWDLWLLPFQGERRAVRYLRTPFNEGSAAISPDGRWVAYDSDETGTPEIYVSSFPEPGEKHRVSTSGGNRAAWSNDGTELVIWTTADVQAFGGGPVLSVDVQTKPAFKVGTPRVLFKPRGDLMGLAMTSDLQRFLAAVPVEGASPASVTIVVNWQAALGGR